MSLAFLAVAASGLGPDATAGGAQPELKVLVTNDDGVSAPGINAAVQALRDLPDTTVTVVAPATNESGTDSRTTPGTLQVTPAKTSGGYPATAVHGYPVDTIIWALDDHGVSSRPNLVVSGINYGQNIGPLAGLSGTVGAARAAYQRGIPALAVSQGTDNGLAPLFSLGATQLQSWIREHRSSLVGARHGPLPQGNLNVPTCRNGRVRGQTSVPQASSLRGYAIGTVNCASRATKPRNDVEAFVEDFAPVSPLRSGAR